MIRSVLVVLTAIFSSFFFSGEASAGLMDLFAGKSNVIQKRIRTELQRQNKFEARSKRYDLFRIVVESGDVQNAKLLLKTKVQNEDWDIREFEGNPEVLSIPSQVVEHEGASCLHLAIQRGDIEMVKVLLDYPTAAATLRFPNGQDMTPLELAVWHGNLEIVKLLMEKYYPYRPMPKGLRVKLELEYQMQVKAFSTAPEDPGHGILREVKRTYTTKKNELDEPRTVIKELLKIAYERGHRETYEYLVAIELNEVSHRMDRLEEQMEQNRRE